MPLIGGIVVIEEFDGTKFIDTFDLELESAGNSSDRLSLKDGKFNVTIQP